MPSSKESSQPRDRIQADLIVGGFLQSEPPGKTKNTGGGSLSLLPENFPTQEIESALQADSLSAEPPGKPHSTL